MQMYELVKYAHSYWAYLVLLALIVASINAILGFFSEKKYGQKDFRIGLFALIATHTQLLLGIIMYLVSPLKNSWSSLGAGVMKDAFLRKMLVEHPFGVIVATILITIGWSLHKKQKTSKGAFGKIALFYSLGLLFILAVLPWKTWLGL